MVSLGARDRTLAAALDGKASLVERCGHALHGLSTHLGPAHDATLPHVLASGLELGLHEREKAPLRAEKLAHGGQYGKH